jgi:hypothetical protein
MVYNYERIIVETKRLISFDTGRASLPEPEDSHMIRTTKLLTAVLTGLDNEAQGDYYDLVPSQYRMFVDGLVERHFSTYAESFPDRNSFAEAMAKNWLGKYRAFAVLAKDTGLNEAKPYPHESKESLNDGVIAALTGNSSYVLLGKGTFGEGASLHYTRLPLREDEKLKDIFCPAGAILSHRPRLDNNLRISYPGGKDQKRFYTSPLIAIYRGDLPNPDEAITRFNATLKMGARTINMMSGIL